MLDDDSFASTTIQFRNSKGEVITLFDVPAFFQDVGMIVQEESCKDKTLYYVSGWQMDDGPYSLWDWWFPTALSPGAGIKLFKGDRYRSIDAVYYDDTPNYREDSCFIVGDVNNVKYIRGTVTKDENGIEWLEISLPTVYEETDVCDPYILVDGEQAYAQDIADNTGRESIVGDLEYFLHYIHGQEFASYKEVDEAITKGLKWAYAGYSDLVSINTKIFDVKNYISRYCIPVPSWSYKWIECREHSGVWYTETCVGECSNWDDSMIDGVWYLGEERVKDLLKLKEQHYKEFLNAGESKEEAEQKAHNLLLKIVQKQFRHDMCVISDFETPYSIYTAVYSRSLSAPDEIMEEAKAQYMYTDFTPDCAYEYMKSIVVDGDDTLIRYTILEETKGNPHPY